MSDKKKPASDKEQAKAAFGGARPQTARTARSEPVKVEDLPQAILPLDSIRPNPFQPRRHFDKKKLASFAADIKERGVLNPIRVLPRDDHYVIIHGERRYRAATLVGLKEIPVTLETRPDYSELQLSLDALAENVQREDLTPVEEYFAVYENLRKLIALELGKEEAAEFDLEGFKKSLNRIKNYRNKRELSKLDELVDQSMRKIGPKPSDYARYKSNIHLWSKELQDAVIERKIAFDAASVIFGMPEDEQGEMLKRAIEEQLSASRIRALLRAKKAPPSKPVKARVPGLKPRLINVLEQLEQAESARVEQKAHKHVDKLEKLLQELEELLKDA